MIRGFEALRTYTGLSENLLRRAFKLYGFPDPVEVREAKALHREWAPAAVRTWLVENQDRAPQYRAALLFVLRDEIRSLFLDHPLSHTPGQLPTGPGCQLSGSSLPDKAGTGAS